MLRSYKLRTAILLSVEDTKDSEGFELPVWDALII